MYPFLQGHGQVVRAGELANQPQLWDGDHRKLPPEQKPVPLEFADQFQGCLDADLKDRWRAAQPANGVNSLLCQSAEIFGVLIGGHVGGLNSGAHMDIIFETVPGVSTLQQERPPQGNLKRKQVWKVNSLRFTDGQAETPNERVVTATSAATTNLHHVEQKYKWGLAKRYGEE